MAETVEITKTSDLPAATTPADADLVPLWQGNQLKKLLYSTLVNAARGDIAAAEAAAEAAIDAAADAEASRASILAQAANVLATTPITATDTGISQLAADWLRRLAVEKLPVEALPGRGTLVFGKAYNYPGGDIHAFDVSSLFRDGKYEIWNVALVDAQDAARGAGFPVVLDPALKWPAFFENTSGKMLRLDITGIELNTHYAVYSGPGSSTVLDMGSAGQMQVLGAVRGQEVQIDAFETAIITRDGPSTYKIRSLGSGYQSATGRPTPVVINTSGAYTVDIANSAPVDHRVNGNIVATVNVSALPIGSRYRFYCQTNASTLLTLQGGGTATWGGPGSYKTPDFVLGRGDVIEFSRIASGSYFIHSLHRMIKTVSITASGAYTLLVHNCSPEITHSLTGNLSITIDCTALPTDGFFRITNAGSGTVTLSGGTFYGHGLGGTKTSIILAAQGTLEVRRRAATAVFDLSNVQPGSLS